MLRSWLKTVPNGTNYKITATPAVVAVVLNSNYGALSWIDCTLCHFISGIGLGA